jgi:hypothetical protein
MTHIETTSTHQTNPEKDSARPKRRFTFSGAVTTLATRHCGKWSLSVRSSA